jgi:hypothetical protein
MVVGLAAGLALPLAGEEGKMKLASERNLCQRALLV